MNVKILPADRWLSLCVRMAAGWRCRMCGNQVRVGSQGLHCAHIFSRRHRATRWLPRNLFALCFGCHRKFDEDHELKREYSIQEIGEEDYDYLNRTRNLITKFNKAEQKAIGDFYRKQSLVQEPGLPVPICPTVARKINDSAD